MTISTTVPTFNASGVISETKRIVKEQSHHFQALTFLFLLPLYVSFFIFYKLQQDSDLKPIEVLLRTTTTNTYTSEHRIKTLARPLIYTLFVFVFSQCAVGTITYSSYHGFYGRPVKLVSAFKSLLHTFIPLLATAAVSQILLVLIGLAFGLFAALTIYGVELLEFEIDYDSVYFSGFYAAFLISLAVVLVYIQVSWSLASGVVVVESKWGLEPLRRSA